MVKKVFSTLLKVPCYIVIGYLVANIIMFGLYYFRALGISYVVMQSAVENNYIPTSELSALNATLSEYNSLTATAESALASGEDLSNVQQRAANEAGAENINVPLVSHFAVFIDTSNSGKTAEDLYVQDSSEDGIVASDGSLNLNNGVTTPSCNVRAQYGQNITVGIGYIYTFMMPMPAKKDGIHSGAVWGETESSTVMEYEKHWYSNAIRISYKVPGLKYYPDL